MEFEGDSRSRRKGAFAEDFSLGHFDESDRVIVPSPHRPVGRESSQVGSEDVSDSSEVALPRVYGVRRRFGVVDPRLDLRDESLETVDGSAHVEDVEAAKVIDGF